MIARALRAGEAVLYPTIGIALLLALWQFAVTWEVIPSFLLPPPANVAAAVFRAAADGTFARHLVATLEAAVIGYTIGCMTAFSLAALIAEFKSAERLLYLHLIAIQSIPKVSLAPLIFLWIGFGNEGKVIIVSLICFFPVFANALAGFRAADPNLIDLLRAVGGSRSYIFTRVKLPTALPHFFAGLEVAVAFALIGCVVTEFVGSARGMGFLIQDSSNTFDLALTFAAVLVLGLVGVVGNTLVRLARRKLLFWETSHPSGLVKGAATSA